MAVNKVEINGVVKLDLTADTVTAAKLAHGETAHDASGKLITGTMIAPQLQIAVTTSAGATVTATKDEIRISGVADDNGSCVLDVPELGTYTVTSVLGSLTATSAVSVEPVFPVELVHIPALNDAAWSFIREASDKNLASNYWSIGDRKAVILNGKVGRCTFENYETYVFILGFNHNSALEGNNTIHFQFGKNALTDGKDICFVDDKYDTEFAGGFVMQTRDNTNSGGWKSSYMRSNICGTSLTSYSGKMIGALPEDLRAVLKSVTKYTDNSGYPGGATADITRTVDYLFLPTAVELKNSVAPHTNTHEKDFQLQYDYYKLHPSMKKVRHTTLASANWWLRSPAVDGAGYAVVTTSGGTNSYVPDVSSGFAPCLCV